MFFEYFLRTPGTRYGDTFQVPFQAIGILRIPQPLAPRIRAADNDAPRASKKRPGGASAKAPET